MSKGMPRSNFEGFRYKPIKANWSRDAEMNLALKQEFENIAAGVNDLAARGRSLEGEVREASGKGEGEDTDRYVALNDQDGDPDVLLEKMRPGANIHFEVSGPGRRGGPLVTISTTGHEMIVIAYDFNSYTDADGNLLPMDSPLRLQMTFLHNLGNEHYLFDMYRPIEETIRPSTVDTKPDGTERGRYQIRWKNIERKKDRLTVWFHQPEFGTCVIYGAGSIRAGQVHRVQVD